MSKYTIIPFQSSNTPLQDLQDILDQHPELNYVGHEYSDKLYPGKAGCFGIGAKPDMTVHIGFIIMEGR